MPAKQSAAKSGEIRFKRFWLNRMNAWWLGCAWQNNRFVERLTLHCFDFKMFFFSFSSLFVVAID
jgi:hypothetical protein